MKNKDLRNPKDLLRDLKKIPKNNLDQEFHKAHEDVFNRFDCLTCANCCKTTGPLFTRADIDRLSRFLKLKPAEFERIYLRIDEEGDWVLKTVPCPFLQEDNRCFVYDQRPMACREYPHTNRRNMQQILDLTVKNYAICPAVEQIVTKVVSKNKQIN